MTRVKGVQQKYTKWHIPPLRKLFVKVVLSFVLFHVVLVALFKVLGQDDVAVFPDGLHAGLLTDGVDVGAGDFVRPSDEVLQVHLLRQVHLRRDGGEDETLLAPIRKGKLDFPDFQTSRNDYFQYKVISLQWNFAREIRL